MRLLSKAKSESPKQLPPVVDEIRNRLRLVSPELTRELLTIAKDQLASTASRQLRLESKANSLTAAAGLSLTVASSLAGPLISRKDVTFPPYIFIILCAVAIMGLGAVGIGIWAAKVRDQATLNPLAIFDEHQLNLADDPPGADNDPPSTRAAFGVGLYRQYITVHMWEVYETNSALLDIKARIIKWGQYSFIGFLIALSIFEALLFNILSNAPPAPHS